VHKRLVHGLDLLQQGHDLVDEVQRSKGNFKSHVQFANIIEYNIKDVVVEKVLENTLALRVNVKAKQLSHATVLLLLRIAVRVGGTSLGALERDRHG